jgi:HK97 family phage major capsid protein
LEARAALVAEMRGYTSNPAGESGDLSAEQSAKFDAAKTKLEQVEKRIQRQQVLDDAERRMEGTPLHTSGDNKLDDQLRKFSLVKAIASQVPDIASRVDCGREREISQELSKRSGHQFQGIAVPMQVFEKRVTTTSAAGDLISTDLLSGQFIDSLRTALVIRRLGARVLSGLMGNVDIPKRTGSSTAGWFAENAAISATDASFDKVSMSPKHVGARTEFSRNMLLQSSPDIEALVRDDFAAILARAVDLAAIDGGGANEPTGVLSTSGLTTVADASTWTKVLQLIETVELENSEGTAFLTDPRVVRKLRSTPKVTSTDSVMIQQEPNSLAGYPLISSNIVPMGPTSPSTDGILIFGKWSDLILGYWSVFDLLVNPYESTAYSKGNVQVRGIITADVAVRHVESFAASTDVTV